MNRVIIIGGIAAGMSAAAKLRRLDKTAEVIVYEKAKYISFGACGLPYYIGGFFDDPNNMIARTKEQFEKTGVNVFVQHEVLSVCKDSKTIQVKNLETGEIFEDKYDKLMVATGAAPTVPPIKNVNLENVYQLRTLEDGHVLKEVLNDSKIKTIAVIGAGFIGLEIIEAAKKKVKEVVVFQIEDTVLSGVFDNEITGILREEISSHDVKLHLNTAVRALKGDTTVTHVITDDMEVQVDAVILATGVKPNTEFIKDTGIECLPNGAIIVDNMGRTSIPDIYSAGDCASIPHLLKTKPDYIPLATTANKLGRIVGENLAGKEVEFEGTLGSSCIKVLDMEAGRTGLGENEAKNLGYEIDTVFMEDKNQTNYYPGQESIWVKLIYDKNSKVLLGGQIVGKKDAVQRTNVIAAAITAKMTTNQLGFLDLCYAPPFARTWDALNIAGNIAK